MFERHAWGGIRSLKTEDPETSLIRRAKHPERQSIAVETGQGAWRAAAWCASAPRQAMPIPWNCLAGRIARVRGGASRRGRPGYAAVTVEDDPAADLHGRYGRHYFFYPDELELLEAKES